MNGRHTCTYCKAKRNEHLMSLVSHPLFGEKTSWICTSHMSEFSDIFDVRNSRQQPLFLELFSGSGHIADAASICGFQTITVDMNPKFKPDIAADICNLNRHELPERVDVVWASIPCTVYSILNLKNHWTKENIGYRRYWYTPATPEARKAIRILEATIRLIRKLKPAYYFFENPRGALRHMPHLKLAPFRRSVHYTDYGFDYPKPTDIFTNNPHFRPIKPTGPPRCKPNSKSVADLNSAYERSLIPPALIAEIIQSVAHLVPGTNAAIDGGEQPTTPPRSDQNPIDARR